MSNIDIITYIILIVLWLYLIRTFKRANVNAWRFFLGSIGTFLIGLISFRPYIVKYINFALTAIVGLFGNITGWYQTLFMESAIFVDTSVGGVLTPTKTYIANIDTNKIIAAKASTFEHKIRKELVNASLQPIMRDMI